MSRGVLWYAEYRKDHRSCEMIAEEGTEAMLNVEIKDVGKTFFENLYDGVLMIDTDYVVQYINPAYTRITGIAEEDIVGLPLKEVRPGARLMEVVNSGKPIVGALRRERDVDYTVNMSPLVEDGKVVGGISIVSNIEDVRKLSKTINKYETEIRRLENRMRSIHRAKYTLDDIIAEDPVSQRLKEDILRLAEKETTILLLGESGTGKELYTNAIHNGSRRKDDPFIAVNCAAFQKELLESELFGYEDGAFTGAKKGGKMGLFEAADRGTIFLDEISEMSMETQGHLLRALQERTIRRIGGIKEIPVDIRVVAATNRDLEQCIAEGTFRHDLYYRIAIYPVRIPPLRERREDILALAEAFCDEQRNALKSNITISEGAKAVLRAYDWPGNVRELRNAIEFSVNNMEGNVIEARHLPYRIQGQRAAADMTAVRRLSDVVREAERREIQKALERFGNDLEGKKQAAGALGISLASLYNKIK